MSSYIFTEQEYIDISENVHEWRDIENYEGLYRVNEYGDILSIGYGDKKLIKPKQDRNGYLYVSLYKNKKQKTNMVHRIVATAFCEGADYFPEVNHIDEDKTNNHYSNLEWCDRKYNVNYGTGTERSSEAHKKRVRCVELDMIFESVNAAANFVGAEATNISKCLKGKYKTCSGYRWQYAD